MTAAVSRPRHAVAKRTEDLRRAPKHRLEMYREEVTPEELEDAERERPKTRADCASAPRPCPFVSCSMNLYLDVQKGTGSVTYHDASRAPEDVPPDQSCALDVADRGGLTLEDMAHLSKLTRERMRQIEAAALRKIALRASFPGSPASVLAGSCDKPGHFDQRGQSEGSSAFSDRDAKKRYVVRETPSSEREEKTERATGERGRMPLSAALRDPSPRARKDACDYAWRLYVRDSVLHGHQKDIVITDSEKFYKGQTRKAKPALARKR